jgi:hypothetical protein
VVNERNTASSHTLKFDIFSHLQHYVSLLLHTVQKYIMFWWCRSMTFVILLELWCLISSNLVSFIKMVWLTLSDLQYLCVWCAYLCSNQWCCSYWAICFGVTFLLAPRIQKCGFTVMQMFINIIILLKLFCTDTFVSLLLLISFIYWHRISKEY